MWHNVTWWCGHARWHTFTITVRWNSYASVSQIEQPGIHMHPSADLFTKSRCISMRSRVVGKLENNTPQSNKENTTFHPTVKFHAALTYWSEEHAWKTTQTANQYLANKFYSLPDSSSYCNYLLSHLYFRGDFQQLPIGTIHLQPSTCNYLICLPIKSNN